MADQLKARISLLQEAEARAASMGKTLKPEAAAELAQYRNQGLAKPIKGGALSPETAQMAKDLSLDEALTAINKARDQVGFFSTGIPGAMLRKVPGTEATDLESTLNTVASQVTQGVLADLKAQSSTGASGFGALSEREGQLLRDAVASLNPSQSSEQLKENLDAVELHFRRLKAIRAGLDPSDPDVQKQFGIKAAGQDKVDIGLNAGIHRKIDEAAGIKPDQPLPTPDYLDDAGQMAFAKLTPEQQRAWTNGEANFPGLPLTTNVSSDDDEPPPPDPKDTARDTFLGAVDAAGRGVADVATFGFSDELAAAGDALSGRKSFADSLRENRDIAARDERVNPLARFGGQVAGGLLLPFKISTPGQAARVGAGVGAAYGFGSTDGSLADRVRGAETGGLTGLAFGYGGAKAAPYIERGLAAAFRPKPAKLASEAVMEAADDLDVPMLPADVGGTGTRMATGAFGRSLGGIPIADAAKKGIRASGEARDRIAGTLGRVTDETGAGQAAQRGAKAFVKTSEERGGELYDQISVPDATPSHLDGTRQALTEITQGLKSNPKLSKLWVENPRLQQTLEALTPDASGAGGQLSWQDLKRFRSIVGEISGSPSLADDGAAKAAMKKLYGALSEDMRATAAATSPRALTEFNRANQYWRGREDRIENVLTGILGNDYHKGEADAFAQINRWAQLQGGDFKRLSQAMRSMPADEASTVRATLFGRMGKAKPGQQDATGLEFSSAEFALQWNKLDPRAKSVLFPNKAHREAIDKLVTVASAQKRAGQYANFSNTALGVNATAGLAGMYIAPLSTLTALGTQFAVGKVLASPKLARMLATPVRSPASAKALAQRFGEVAAKDPALAAEAGAIQQAILKAVNDNSLTRAAASGDNPRSEQDRSSTPR